MKKISLIWDYDESITSQKELRNYHNSIGLNSIFTPIVPPYVTVIVIPLFIFCFGVILSWNYWMVADFLQIPMIYAFSIVLAIAIFNVLWLDRNGIDTIVEISSAFRNREEYFQLMGEFVERTYEPLPHVALRKNHIIHMPVFLMVFIGTILFVVLPPIYFESGLTRIIGTEWSSVPIFLRGYFLSLFFIGVIVGSLVSWVVFSGIVYFGLKIQKLQINLRLTRDRRKLGLYPYNRVILFSLLCYMVAYASTTVFAIQEPNAVFIIGAVIMSVLPLFGFIGSQYGLHKAIVRSKDQRLEELREEFRQIIDYWFVHSEPNPSKEDLGSGEISELIAFKGAIEEIPEWPININSFYALVSVTIASNFWVIFQIVGIIE